MHLRNFLFFILFPYCVQVIAQDKSEFTLVREEGPIFIYERWVTFPGSDPPFEAREVKGEFTINTSIHEAVKLIKDEEKLKSWQKHVTEFKIYPKHDLSTWIEYSYHNIPWPVSDQDHLLNFKLEKIDSAEVYISFKSCEDKKIAPKREGVTRMNLIGSWAFKTISKNQVKATYCIISQPSSIPRIFTDPVVRRNLMSTIKSYIKILEEESIKR